MSIATIGGAEAIGVDERFGTLAAGKFADLALFAVSGADPVLAVVERGGSDSVRAVMSGGRWRVADGELLSADAAAAKRVASATARAREALAAARG